MACTGQPVACSRNDESDESAVFRPGSKGLKLGRGQRGNGENLAEFTFGELSGRTLKSISNKHLAIQRGHSQKLARYDKSGAGHSPSINHTDRGGLRKICFYPSERLAECTQRQVHRNTLRERMLFRPDGFCGPVASVPLQRENTLLQ